LAESEEHIQDDIALDRVRSRFVTMVALAGGRPDAELVLRLLDHPDPRIRLGAFPAGSQLLLAQGRVDDAVALAEAQVPAALELTRPPAERACLISNVQTGHFNLYLEQRSRTVSVELRWPILDVRKPSADQGRQMVEKLYASIAPDVVLGTPGDR